MSYPLKNLTAFVVLLLLLSSVQASTSPSDFTDPLAGTVLVGGTGAKAFTDSVYVLGDPSTPEGQFESWGTPDWQGWMGVDRSSESSHWKTSTFNAAALDPGQPDNHAWWCGEVFTPCAGDPPEGYGNNWDESLHWVFSVPDPGLSCEIQLMAVFNLDLDPAGDQLILEYETTGGWVPVNTWSGMMMNWWFSEVMAYDPVDYVGISGDQIHVRFRLTSDAFGSDEDGGYCGAGAVQIDLIDMYYDQGAGPIWAGMETAEPGAPSSWYAGYFPPVGEFAQIWPPMSLGTADPFIDSQETFSGGLNLSHMVGFIDDGLQVPTGGEVGLTWQYAAGGYVVNHSGGLTGPDGRIWNEIWSPVLEWPAGNFGRARLEFDLYLHNLVETGASGIFGTYAMRGSQDGGATWSDWRSHHDYLFGGPALGRFSRDVTALLPQSPTHVQISLGVRELSQPFWDGSDATPAPYFDNVVLKAYESTGPLLTAEDADLPQDAFPSIGFIDYGNLGANSIPVDMARNIAPLGSFRVQPGDSIVVTARAVSPGGVIQSPPLMHYHLEANPEFDPYRWWPTFGTLVADSCLGPDGVGLPGDRWCFDVPDEGFMFPGDVMHFSFEVSEDQFGSITTATLPEDLTHFYDFQPGSLWPRQFEMRGLPSVLSQQPADQPPIIFWRDCDPPAGTQPWILALENQGYTLGYDYDVYQTRAPGGGHANGLGGRANSTLLANYDVILYTSGDQIERTLQAPDEFEPEDDISLLESWLSLGNKNLVLCGDNLAWDLATGDGLEQGFLATWFPLTVEDSDVRPLIDGQDSPLALALAGNPTLFTLPAWRVLGGERGHTYDAVVPVSPTTALGEFADPYGNPGAYPEAAATRTHHLGLNDRVFFLPYDLGVVADAAAKYSEPVTRSLLLNDILIELGIAPGGVPIFQADLDQCTASTAATGPVSIYNIPNGQGSGLDEAQTWGAGAMDARISVVIRDGLGQPIPGYPWEDLWLESDGGGLAHCPGGTHPDGPTDADGMTTFTGPFRAGGHTQSGESLFVMVDGQPIWNSTFPQIACNSPDIDGDLDVDLMDLTWFADDFCGVYNFRSDFRWDGVINLSDIAILAGAWGAGDRTTAVVDPLRGTVEIYFDDGSGCRRNSLPDTLGVVEAVMVLKTQEPDLVAWEMQLEITGDATIVGNSYGGATNYLSSPQLFAVAGCTPVPVVDGEVELGRITLLVGPGGPVEIFIRPMDPSSIPLTDQPAFLTSARDAYKGMVPISGDYAIPVAAINAPESGVPRGSVLVQPSPAVDHPWQLASAGYDTAGQGVCPRSGLPFGQYTVTWLPDFGWRRPRPAIEAQCMYPPDSTVTFAGQFLPAGWVRIDAAPDSLQPWWMLTAPDTVLVGNGDDLLEEMLTGSYFMEWNDYPDWRTPPDITGSLAQYDTLVFAGEYLPTGMVRIDVEPDSLLAGWTLTAPDTVIAGAGDQDLPGMLTGGYTLHWADLPGWDTPDSVTGILTQADTLAFFGEYLEQEATARILSIVDVGNDQGRNVRITWQAHPFDAPEGDVVITGYGIYRRQDEWKAAGKGVRRTGPGKLLGWDALGTVSARQDSMYQFVAGTLCDSTEAAGICWSVFMISAETPDPGVFFDSPPDSGYSIDNLVPVVPQDLLVQYAHDGNALNWSPNPDPDIQHYRIYRSELAGKGCESPPADPTGMAAETHWVDSLLEGGNAWDYCYRITAVDFAGNESGLSDWGQTEVSGAAQPPDRLVFYPAVPNPFNATTTLSFDLPDDLVCRLTIFDVAGKRVRALLEGDLMRAGRREVIWDGRDQKGQMAATGVYFVRLEAGSWARTLRVALVK
ncbi:MAG: FlgD immunoglobulin-like domain containing protein [bacterium]